MPSAPNTISLGAIQFRQMHEVVASCLSKGCAMPLLTRAGRLLRTPVGVKKQEMGLAADGHTLVLRITCPRCNMVRALENPAKYLVIGGSPE